MNLILNPTLLVYYTRVPVLPITEDTQCRNMVDQLGGSACRKSQQFHRRANVRRLCHPVSLKMVHTDAAMKDAVDLDTEACIGPFIQSQLRQAQVTRERAVLFLFFFLFL